MDILTHFESFTSERQTCTALRMKQQLKYPNRIKEIRELNNLSMEKLADLLHTSRGQVYQLEKGIRKLSQPWMERLAVALRCSPADFIQEPSYNLVPVLSYVGAGAKVYAIDDHAQGGGLEEVEAPTGYSADGIIALIVRGDSMEPQMEAGWLIFYRRESDGVPPDCIGELCVVKMHDDCVLVKKLRQGSKPGLFHLLSKNPNHEPIFDAKLKWASRVIDIRPR